MSSHPSGNSRFRSAQVLRRWAIRLSFVLLLALIVDYFAYPWLSATVGRSGNRGENGLWLRYDWYLGRHSDIDRKALAGRLASQQIRYAYFHVRHLEADGRLRYRNVDSARELTRGLHRDAPSVRLIAWIYAGDIRSAPGLAKVDLSNERVRRSAAQQARWLTETCGFDGVQWDYENCRDGDTYFLDLLAETRAALPSGKLICVAAPLRFPAPVTHWRGWGSPYFSQVAARCDQIAVMAYDSGMFLPRAYVDLLGQQVSEVSRAAFRGNPGCRILIGLPTYVPGGPSHHAHAENLAMGLRGVRLGLAAGRRIPDNFAGIALFADHTTTPRDWRTYGSQWLDHP